MYEDIEREEPLPSPGARIHRDTALVRLTCDSIGPFNV
jgi:hypothetical protein